MTVSRLGPGGYPKEPYSSFLGRLPVAALILTNITGYLKTAPGAFSTGFSTGFFVDYIHTDVLPLPINCVIAGQQKEPIKGAMLLEGGMIGALRGIFRE